MQLSTQGAYQLKLRECRKDMQGHPICDLVAYAATADERARGIFTIAYGNTYMPDGSKVVATDKVTQKQADKIFEAIVSEKEQQLNNLLHDSHLTQPQYDAVFSFFYNVPPNDFANSTMLRLIRQGNISLAGQQFVRWIYQNHKPVNGLLNRRVSERDQFYLSSYPIDEVKEITQ